MNASARIETKAKVGSEDLFSHDAAERNYPAHELERLAMVHALRVFKHYLLGSGTPRHEECWSDFDLRTDNQAITWLKTNRHLNQIYVCWLDEMEDFRFDVTHLQGSQNPADSLTLLRPDHAGGGFDVRQTRRPARRRPLRPLPHPAWRDVFIAV
jgi:hypothetical protein